MNVLERFQKSFAFNLGVGTIEFGSDKINQLGGIVKSMGAKHVLIVTDKGVIKAGILEKVVAPLADAKIKVTVFDKIEPNPIDTTVEEGAELYKKINPDVIIGLGGGSAIDSAKAISILATNPGTIRDFQIHTEEDFHKLKNHPAPLITIATTSGTGTEGNFWAIITNTDNWSKMAIGGPPCYPGGPCIAAKICIDDPTLTITLPKFQTATTGIDAFAHHYDGYTANVANPISDALSEYSMPLISDYLPIAYSNGKDLQAREMIMLASCLGGISFANSDCTGVHCLSEALGGLYGNPPKPVIAHGLGCALFLPWVMEYNCITDPVKHMKVAKYLGEDTSGLSLYEAAHKCVDGIKKLIKSVDIPTSLEACGVEEKDLEAIAERATWNVSLESNPRELTYDVFVSILQKAFKGW
jgi:alcohol dehydrogenase class IV